MDGTVYDLVVVEAFGDYRRGDKITGGDVAKVLTSDNAGFVRKVGKEA